KTDQAYQLLSLIVKSHDPYGLEGGSREIKTTRMGWPGSRPCACFISAGFRAGPVRTKPNPPTGHHQWAASQRSSCDCIDGWNANIHLFESTAVRDSGWRFAGVGMLRPGNQRLALERVAAVAAACPASAGFCLSATADGDLSTAADGDLPATGSGHRHLHEACSRDRRPGILSWSCARCSSDQCDRQDCKRSDTGFLPVSARLLRASGTPAMVI